MDEPAYVSILAVDIEQFGRPAWTDPIRLRLRGRLHRLIDHALQRSRIDSSRAYQIDTGDGLLLMIAAVVPTIRLLNSVVPLLTARLQEDNRAAPPGERIRLRLVVHAGDVLQDAYGRAGEALNHAARLLGAQAGRRVLGAFPGVDLVVLASEDIYQRLVSQGYDRVDPAHYQPIWVVEKETSARAWISLPGRSSQPDLADVLGSSIAGLPPQAITATWETPLSSGAVARREHPAAGPGRRLVADVIGHPGGRWLLASSRGLSQLPRDIYDFVNREELLAEISMLLTRERTEERTAPTILVLAGQAGVGKTTLALRAAHQAMGDFPDGQLYVALGGGGGAPADPSDVLVGLLRSLGLPLGSLPESLDERARLYRAVLAGRRVLLLLDDVASEAQARPLLPGTRSAVVLLTARQPLALAGARTVRIGVLNIGASLLLLGNVAGHRRVGAEREAAAEIARMCGHLPFALRIAGARLAARREWPLALFADLLGDERRRLDELAAADLEVRTMFTVAYQARPPDEQRLFRLLGLLPLDLAAWTAAVLTDRELDSTRELLEHLVDAELLDTAGTDATGQPRYRLHGLLGVFARERLRAEESASEQREALERVLGAYARLAERASEIVQPGGLRYVHDMAVPDWHAGELAALEPTLLSDCWKWFSAERASLIAAVGLAYDAGMWELAWRLPATLAYFLEVQVDWKNWNDVSELGLEAARRAGDRLGEAAITRNLGRLLWYRTSYDRAIEYFQEALTAFRTLGDRRLAAWTLKNLGDVHRDQGHLDEALAFFEEALPVFGEVGDQRGAAWTLRPMGDVYREKGRLDKALDSFDRAITIFRDLDDRLSEALATITLADTYRAQERYDAAADHLERVLPIFRDLKDRHAEAVTLRSLGDVRREQGQYGEALTSFNQARTIFEELGDRMWAARVQSSIGSLRAAQGDREEAKLAWRDAFEAFQELGTTESEKVEHFLVNNSVNNSG